MTTAQVKRVAIYARQSSGEGEEASDSIQSQLDRLKQLAKDRNYSVVLTATDPDTSGRTYPDTPEAKKLVALDTAYRTHFENRPVYRKGLGKVFQRLNDLDAILIYDSTRLMRPLANSHLESYVKSCLNAHNIIVVTPTGESIDYTEYTTQITTTLDSLVQDNALKVNKEKSAAVLRRKQDAGEIWNGKFSMLYGYETDRKHRVSIVPQEAETVRYCYSEYAKGKGVNTIVKALNARKTPPRSGKHWVSSGIRNMLQNIGYIGCDYDSSGAIIKVHGVPAILDEAQYWEVQKRFTSRPATARETAKTHPLTGHLRCAYCGGKLKLRMSNKDESGQYSYFYSCYNAFHNTTNHPECKTVRVLENHNHSYANLNLTRIGLLQALTPLMFGVAIQEHQEAGKVAGNSQGTLETLKHNRASILERQKALVGQLAQGTLNPALLSAAYDKTEEDLARVNGEIVKLEQAVKHDWTLQDFDWQRWAYRPLDVYDYEGKDIVLFRRLVEQLVETVYVALDKITIAFRNGSKVVLPMVKVQTYTFLPIPQGVPSMVDSNGIRRDFPLSLEAGKRAMALLGLKTGTSDNSPVLEVTYRTPHRKSAQAREVYRTSVMRVMVD